MKTRHLLTVALAALALYVLGPGCTQDFGVFQTCDFGFKPCDGECVAINDPKFGCAPDGCAPCDVANADAVCDQLLCAVGSCVNPFQNCNGAKEDGCEVDPKNDPANCGACGNNCVVPHAQAACTGGVCSVGTCDPGFEDCNTNGSDGCEVNTDSDPQNCGGCGNQCGAFQTCVASKCTLVCPDGTGDCNNDPTDGCETQFGTTLNCAFCNDTCDLANAAAACTAGECVVTNCQNGFGNCDNMDANGCEADLLNSAMTCGTCANACPNGPNGTTVCNNGTCAINCDAGTGNCDQNLANGCETDTTSSVQACGGCNQPCAPQNGTGQCTGGVCMLGMCNGTFDDCDGNAGNGCETNTATSLQSCGMCGAACSFAHAAAMCMNGACSMGMCNAGFANCNNDPSDGCETAIGTDPSNCGMCGNACPTVPNASATCMNGACGTICDAGFGNCDGNAANGCETNTATNVQSCGACGRACSNNNVASRSCTDGLCDSACAVGFSNCSQPAAPMADNGCETGSLSGGSGSTGKANCGGCGNNCGAQGGGNDGFECDQPGGGGQQFCGCSSSQECGDGGFGTCALGLCICGAAQCAVGEACGAGNVCSCNGGAACGAGQSCCAQPAGCVNLQTDAASCGACGHVCSPGFACASGACVCDSDADCNAGTAGTCAVAPGNGRCTCGGNQCAVGQRCQANGQCG